MTVVQFSNENYSFGGVAKRFSGRMGVIQRQAGGSIDSKGKLGERTIESVAERKLRF